MVPRRGMITALSVCGRWNAGACSAVGCTVSGQSSSSDCMSSISGVVNTTSEALSWLASNGQKGIASSSGGWTRTVGISKAEEADERGGAKSCS